MSLLLQVVLLHKLLGADTAAAPLNRTSMTGQGESTVSFDRAAPCAVHWLPCDIQYTGEAPVSQYFVPRPAAGNAP